MPEIQRPRQQEDIFDKINKGLNIAQSVYGIYSDATKLGLAKDEASRKAAEDEKNRAKMLGLEDANSEQSKQARSGYQQLGFKVAETDSAKGLAERFGDLASLNKEQFKTSQEMRRDAAKARAEGGGSELAVPGFQPMAGYKPTKDDAKQLKETVTVAKNLSTGIDDLKSMIKQSGTELFGADAERMKRRVDDIKLQLKSLHVLGQLSASDLEMLESQISDPTTLGAFFTRNSRFLKNLGDLASQTDAKVKNVASARGFNPVDGGQQKAPPPTQLTHNGKPLPAESVQTAARQELIRRQGLAAASQFAPSSTQRR